MIFTATIQNTGGDLLEFDFKRKTSKPTECNFLIVETRLNGKIHKPSTKWKYLIFGSGRHLHTQLPFNYWLWYNQMKSGKVFKAIVANAKEGAKTYKEVEVQLTFDNKK